MVSAVFLLSDLTLPLAHAQSLKTLPGVLSLSDVNVPSNIGKLEERFEGQEGTTVIFIQDAHGIPHAQRNIRNLIDYFQQRHGVGLVAVEGASSKLDPSLFRSFPEAPMIKKVFNYYLEKGELSGVAMAAIFNEIPGDYEGIEDWGLYERGYAAYLKALDDSEELGKKLKAWDEDLESSKDEIYSEKLRKIDRDLKAFSRDSLDLLDILKSLADVKAPPPGSELELMLEEAARDEGVNVPVDLEVKKIAEQVRRYLEAPGVNRDLLMSFNDKIQKYRLSQIRAEEFALFLKDMIQSEKLDIEISGNLLQVTKRQKRMTDIEGTRFFDAFQEYVDRVTASLITTEDERSLSREGSLHLLIEKLSTLELTRKQWNDLKPRLAEILAVRYAALDVDRDLKWPLAFYQNAEARDESLYDKLMSLRKRKNTGPIIMVAGGFHTEGLVSRLREAGVSYMLLMPAIESLPAEVAYKEHMRGNVSWSDYFEIKDGRLDVYKAFVRHTRDELISLSGDTRGRLLKNWRDQVLRNLAEEGRIAEAVRYTRYIDEASGGSVKVPDESQLLLNRVENFIQGLRDLGTTNRFNEQNIMQLIRPSGIPAPAVGINMAPSDQLGTTVTIGFTGNVLSVIADYVEVTRPAAVPMTETEEKGPGQRSELRTKYVLEPFPYSRNEEDFAYQLAAAIITFKTDFAGKNANVFSLRKLDAGQTLQDKEDADRFARMVFERNVSGGDYSEIITFFQRLLNTTPRLSQETAADRIEHILENILIYNNLGELLIYIRGVNEAHRPQSGLTSPYFHINELEKSWEAFIGKPVSTTISVELPKDVALKDKNLDKFNAQLKEFSEELRKTAAARPEVIRLFQSFYQTLKRSYEQGKLQEGVFPGQAGARADSSRAGLVNFSRILNRILKYKDGDVNDLFLLEFMREAVEMAKATSLEASFNVNDITEIYKKTLINLTLGNYLEDAAARSLAVRRLTVLPAAKAAELLDGEKKSIEARARALGDRLQPIPAADLQETIWAPVLRTLGLSDKDFTDMSQRLMGLTEGINVEEPGRSFPTEILAPSPEEIMSFLSRAIDKSKAAKTGAGENEGQKNARLIKAALGSFETQWAYNAVGRLLKNKPAVTFAFNPKGQETLKAALFAALSERSTEKAAGENLDTYDGIQYFIDNEQTRTGDHSIEARWVYQDPVNSVPGYVRDAAFDQIMSQIAHLYPDGKTYRDLIKRVEAALHGFSYRLGPIRGRSSVYPDKILGIMQKANDLAAAQRSKSESIEGVFGYIIGAITAVEQEQVHALFLKFSSSAEAELEITLPALKMYKPHAKAIEVEFDKFQKELKKRKYRLDLKRKDMMEGAIEAGILLTKAKDDSLVRYKYDKADQAMPWFMALWKMDLPGAEFNALYEIIKKMSAREAAFLPGGNAAFFRDIEQSILKGSGADRLELIKAGLGSIKQKAIDGFAKRHIETPAAGILPNIGEDTRASYKELAKRIFAGDDAAPELLKSFIDFHSRLIASLNEGELEEFRFVSESSLKGIEGAGQLNYALILNQLLKFNPSDPAFNFLGLFIAKAEKTRQEVKDRNFYNILELNEAWSEAYTDSVLTMFYTTGEQRLAFAQELFTSASVVPAFLPAVRTVAGYLTSRAEDSPADTIIKDELTRDILSYKAEDPSSRYVPLFLGKVASLNRKSDVPVTLAALEDALNQAKAEAFLEPFKIKNPSALKKRLLDLRAGQKVQVGAETQTVNMKWRDADNKSTPGIFDQLTPLLGSALKGDLTSAQAGLEPAIALLEAQAEEAQSQAEQTLAKRAAVKLGKTGAGFETAPPAAAKLWLASVLKMALGAEAPEAEVARLYSLFKGVKLENREGSQKTVGLIDLGKFKEILGAIKKGEDPPKRLKLLGYQLDAAESNIAAAMLDVLKTEKDIVAVQVNGTTRNKSLGLVIFSRLGRGEKTGYGPTEDSGAATYPAKGPQVSKLALNVFSTEEGIGVIKIGVVFDALLEMALNPEVTDTAGKATVTKPSAETTAKRSEAEETVESVDLSTKNAAKTVRNYWTVMRLIQNDDLTVKGTTFIDSVVKSLEKDDKALDRQISELQEKVESADTKEERNKHLREITGKEGRKEVVALLKEALKTIKAGEKISDEDKDDLTNALKAHMGRDPSQKVPGEKGAAADSTTNYAEDLKVRITAEIEKAPVDPAKRNEEPNALEKKADYFRYLFFSFQDSVPYHLDTKGGVKEYKEQYKKTVFTLRKDARADLLKIIVDSTYDAIEEALVQNEDLDGVPEAIAVNILKFLDEKYKAARLKARKEGKESKELEGWANGSWRSQRKEAAAQLAKAAYLYFSEIAKAEGLIREADVQRSELRTGKDFGDEEDVSPSAALVQDMVSSGTEKLLGAWAGKTPITEELMSEVARGLSEAGETLSISVVIDIVESSALRVVRNNSAQVDPAFVEKVISFVMGNVRNSLGNRNLVIGLDVSSNDSLARLDNIINTLIAAKEELDRVVLTGSGEKGSVAKSLKGANVSVDNRTTVSGYSERTLDPTQKVIPHVTSQAAFALVNKLFVAIGISNIEASNDPFVELTESVMQIAAGLAIAGSVENENDLKTEEGRIKVKGELLKILFSPDFASRFKENIENVIIFNDQGLSIDRGMLSSLLMDVEFRKAVETSA